MAPLRVFSCALVLLVLVAACSTTGRSNDTDWGPLAVVRDDGSAGLEEFGGSGTLRINGECVTMVPEHPEDPEPDVTLVWPSGLTTWDAASETIIFESGEGVTRLKDGDPIEIDGTSEFRGDWISAPDGDCPESAFLVYGL